MRGGKGQVVEKNPRPTQLWIAEVVDISMIIYNGDWEIRVMPRSFRSHRAPKK